MFDFNKFYEVSSLKEIVGNSASLKRMIKFADDINLKNKRIPLLISGPPGIGKTVAVYLLAKKYNWNIIELNASDYRDTDSINKLIVSANTRDIFGKKNLIFFDEIDELMPKFDKGAEPAIIKLINNSKMPIIFSANNRWNKKIIFLRNKSESIEFKALTENDIKVVLNELIERLSLKKKYNISEAMITAIAKICKGDARSAINDLFAMLGSNSSDMEEIGMRDRKANIFESLDKIFLSNTLTAPLVAAAMVDVDNKMLLNWLDQNIPNRYINALDKYNAFQMLSKASIFYSRALRTQYYIYWRYMNIFMSSGIALSKTNYPSTLKRYEFPKIILELSGSKNERDIKNVIANKLKKVIHSNKKRIINEEMKVIANIIKSSDDDKILEFLEFYLKLEPKEIKWLKEYE